MTRGEGFHIWLLAFAVFWSVESAAILLASVREAERDSAWRWVAVFAASSLVAAYSFWRLLSYGGAA